MQTQLEDSNEESKTDYAEYLTPDVLKELQRRLDEIKNNPDSTMDFDDFIKDLREE